MHQRTCRLRSSFRRQPPIPRPCCDGYLTCRPPTGDIVLTDFTLARSARGASQASVRIGAMAVNVPMTLEGRGRNRAVSINLPQRPPILAAVQPNDRLSVTVNNQTVTYAEGGPARMREVAYACWGS